MLAKEGCSQVFALKLLLIFSNIFEWFKLTALEKSVYLILTRGRGPDYTPLKDLQAFLWLCTKYFEVKVNTLNHFKSQKITKSNVFWESSEQTCSKNSIVSSIKSLPKCKVGSVMYIAPLNPVSSVIQGKDRSVMQLETRIASI